MPRRTKREEIEDRAAAKRRELSERAKAIGLTRAEIARAVGRAAPTITKFLDGPPSSSERLAAEIEVSISEHERSRATL